MKELESKVTAEHQAQADLEKERNEFKSRVRIYLVVKINALFQRVGPQGRKRFNLIMVRACYRR